ncbi:Homoaconitase large subunit [Neomoorella glycerini]|uniref:Homoaconitase large subunit n=1 Tax=Neomoorella glycerini TaxID=55779 RepID=A0A6I5ZPU0_9FIRM|nr:aconitase family protein [Moorella glycerini]QGP91635.1 Homoaconitase large subunit [Moorella glycerini]
MNFLLKSLAAAAGKGQVAPGEEITINVDLMLAHDGSAGKVLAAWPAGERVACPERVVFTLDHTLPAPAVASRQLHREMQAFARREGIHLFDRGEGVLHQVVAERFTPRAGMIIAGADGHVATAGAFGAIAFSLKPEELVSVLVSGKLQLKVPEIYNVQVKGKMPPGVAARDLALAVLKHLDRETVKGRALGFQGPGVWGLSTAGRMALCNLIGETGAVTGLIIPPQAVVPGVKPNLEVELENLEPVVACPPSPFNVRPLKELEGLPITQAVVGGCASGRLEDLRELALGLNGRKVHREVTLLVTPASRDVLHQMEREGLARVLRDLGAIILPPGCGPCPGIHLGLLAPGDRALAATVRNVPGRMGSEQSEIYLASPRTVGAAAAAGNITAGGTV